MTIRTVLITGAALGVLWAASLFMVYDSTRTKWHRLGVSSGELSGRSLVVHDLCRFAEAGPAPEPVLWSHSVKASIVELSGSTDQINLYCR